MSLTSEGPAGSPGSPRKLNHCFLKGSAGSRGYLPSYYFEAKIDFADVRSGFRESCTAARALEIHSLDGDALWTEDMARLVEPEDVTADRPEGARLLPLPPVVTAEQIPRLESKIAGFLMRYYDRRLIRNSSLNLYSTSSESLEDFRERCREVLSEPFRRELDGLREVFERKLDRIKESYLREDSGGDFDRARFRSQRASRVHDLAARLTQMFLDAEIEVEPRVAETPRPPPVLPEFEQKLVLLEAEARGAIARVSASYGERVLNNDEYVVRPNFRDIHVVHVCVLWLPSDGGE